METPDAGEAEDYDENPTVIAIDPGGLTGWALIQVHPEALGNPDVMILDNITYKCDGQLEGLIEIHQSLELLELLDAWEGAAVVIEDFILQQFSMGRELLSPVRITSHIEAFCQVFYEPTPRPIFKQMPSHAMGMVTDDRLRRWGLYRRNSGVHARDAMRHAISFLRRCDESLELRRDAWPHIYGETDRVTHI